MARKKKPTDTDQLAYYAVRLFEDHGKRCRSSSVVPPSHRHGSHRTKRRETLKSSRDDASDSDAHKGGPGARARRARVPRTDERGVSAEGLNHLRFRLAD